MRKTPCFWRLRSAPGLSARVTVDRAGLGRLLFDRVEATAADRELAGAGDDQPQLDLRPADDFEGGAETVPGASKLAEPAPANSGAAGTAPRQPSPWQPTGHGRDRHVGVDAGVVDREDRALALRGEFFEGGDEDVVAGGAGAEQQRRGRRRRGSAAAAAPPLYSKTLDWPLWAWAGPRRRSGRRGGCRRRRAPGRRSRRRRSAVRRWADRRRTRGAPP